MIVGIPKEALSTERRVALVPSLISALRGKKVEVVIEKGAGVAAGFPDDAYTEQGARVAVSRSEVYTTADVIFRVRAAGVDIQNGEIDLQLARKGQCVIGFCDPLTYPNPIRDWASRGVNLLSIELMPRISRAQSMDALSSMATISGYKAVVLAADTLPRMFPLMMTAAGTITPARVFILGAGVAGLQAIATARRLGGLVHAFDVRPAVREQVESLGAKFVEVPLETASAEGSGGYAKQMDESFYRRQQELLAEVVKESDVVISTAAIPGKKAPILVTTEMVRRMRPGSVIVDLAAERGGNCELTQPDRTVVDNGVTILGPTNLPATIPYHASQMYAKNLVTLLSHLVKDGAISLDTRDEITRETLVTHEGSVVNPRVRELLGMGANDPIKVVD